MTEIEEFNVTLLIDELKSENSMQRINSLNNIIYIIDALSTKRVEEELFPYI